MGTALSRVPWFVIWTIFNRDCRAVLAHAPWNPAFPRISVVLTGCVPQTTCRSVGKDRELSIHGAVGVVDLRDPADFELCTEYSVRSSRHHDAILNFP